VRLRNAAVTLSILILGFTGWAIMLKEQEKKVRGQLAERRAFAATVEWPADPAKALLLAEGALQVAPNDDQHLGAYYRMTEHLTREAPEQVSSFEAGIIAIGFSRDLNRAAFKPFGAPPQLVTLGSAAASVLLEEPDSLANYNAFSFSADRSHVAAIAQHFVRSEAKPGWLRVWRCDTGKLEASRDLLALKSERFPEILGFTPDGNAVVIQTSDADLRFRCYVLKWSSPDPAPQPLVAAHQFQIGQLDLTRGRAVVVRDVGAGASEVHYLDLATGKTAAAWSPARFEGTITQIFCAGDVLAVAFPARSNEGRKVSFLSLETGTPLVSEKTFDTGAEALIWDLDPQSLRLLVIYRYPRAAISGIASFARDPSRHPTCRTVSPVKTDPDLCATL
jgi:hypothetical protein